MTLIPLKSKAAHNHKELVILLLASFSCVTILTVGIARGNGIQVGGLGLSQLVLLVMVVAGAFAAGFMVWQTTRHARGDIRYLRDENRELRRRLATADTVVGAEPQVLMYWEIGGALRVVNHTLLSIDGLPDSEDALLRFQGWLDQKSARDLEVATKALFQRGQPFNVILKTSQGGHLEAEGRASAGRAVLRFLDVTGYKRDISRISDTHEQLARDVRTSRALMDSLPIPTWLKDEKGRITWVNSAYLRAVETESVDEAIAKQTELLEQRQRQTIAEKLRTGKRYQERLSLITNGERRAHDVIVVPFSDGFAGAAIDVANIESTQGELNRQIEAYDRTLDRVATAVSIFNPDRKLVFFNQAFCDLWDLDPVWLKTNPRGSDVLDSLREQGRLPEVVNYREWRDGVLEAPQEVDTSREDLWNLPDGRLLHVIADRRPDGSVTFLFVDETEQVALQSQFNAMIQVQGETLDSLTDGVAVFAPDGRLKLHNRAFASIWKLSPVMLDGEPHIDKIISIARVLYNDRATWARLKQVVTAFSDNRTPVDGQMLRPDNSVIDFATTPLPDGATLLTFVDVTDSKHYERALVERNEALMASDQLKNRFLGHVSYQLRTPLTNIIGFSELLASPYLGELTDKQQEYVQDITFSSKTLLSIIDGILDLATIDAGEMELELTSVDVRKVIDDAVVGIQERALSAGLTLDIAISDDVDTLVADAARLRQVLYNLLSNAVGFSKDGGEVRVSCWKDDGQMVFEIEDNGIGISEEAQGEVFDRFVSNSQGSKHRGAGLGLSVIKSLVELHGGDVALKSAPNEGTTVTVRLPIHGLNKVHDPELGVAASLVVGGKIGGRAR